MTLLSAVLLNLPVLGGMQVKACLEGRQTLRQIVSNQPPVEGALRQVVTWSFCEKHTGNWKTIPDSNYLHLEKASNTNHEVTSRPVFIHCLINVIFTKRQRAGEQV